jgi:uncharacterized membrane protein (DUF2068 family)
LSTVAHSHRTGIRAVAFLEILKGIAAVLGGIALLIVMHRSDLGDFIEDIVFKLHLNPSSRLPWFLIDKAYEIKNKNVYAFIGILAAYAAVRFAEGYGLWHERVWAEWFALLSGCAYIPFEVYEIIHRPMWIKWVVLLINIGIVLYIAYIRFYDPDPQEVRTADPAT